MLATIGMTVAARQVSTSTKAQSKQGRFHPKIFTYGLAGYGLFGVGYIGYMTFVVALLKQQGMASSQITSFYTLLGIGVFISSFIWARMLDRFRGGQSMAILNLLLAVATMLPILSPSPIVAFISGALFGSVFLSVVASTTALVRHNLPQALWPAGISAFTIVFAFGQIVGPTVAGWFSDGPGGLRRGFVFSAITLAAGALLAARQRESI
jgi:predicted MFS family arabinose efflux permease